MLAFVKVKSFISIFQHLLASGKTPIRGKKFLNRLSRVNCFKSKLLTMKSSGLEQFPNAFFNQFKKASIKIRALRSVIIVSL